MDYYACGEDMDVLEMSLEDSMKRLDPNSVHYSLEYLTDCRTKLIQKVAQYRQQLETSTSNNTKLIYKHRQEIERIRSFYQNLMHAPTRTGRIVKAACTTSHAAVKIMQELGLKYKYNADSYVVY